MKNEIEQESLSCGAPCFVRKPIKPNDPNNMWKHALDHRINDGSIQDDTDGSEKIQDDTDGSKKIQEKTSSSDPCDGDSSSKTTKRVMIKWTTTLENEFSMAIEHIGVHKATPKKILKFMNQKSLTRAHIASKLQKYRRNLKRDEEQRTKERIATHSTLSSEGGYINPQHSYNYNTRLGNNNLFNVQPGYGLGQSSFMGNNNAGLHDSLNCMNRRPTYDLSQTGSKLLPMRGNLGFQNDMLPVKEEWRSIPGTSQAPRFGQYGTTSNALGMNYNPTTGTTGSNNYVGIRGDENGDLVGLGGLRDNGNGNGSFSGARVHGTGSGSLQGMSVYGNGHGSSLGGRGVHGTDNGSLEGIRVPGNGHGSLGGRGVHGTGNGSLKGIRVPGGRGVHGTGNGSLEGIRVPGNGHGSLGGRGVHGTGNGSLEGIRVHGAGNGHGSLGGIRIHGNDNGIRVHDTSNGYGSFGGVKVHGTNISNDSPDGIIVHGNSNSNDSLGGIRVHGAGNGHGSFGGIRIHGNDNGIRVHDTSNGYGSFGGVKVHGTGNSNGSPDGIIVHGNSTSNDSLGEIRVHGTDSVGGIRVHGTDAGSVGGRNVHGTSNGHGSLGGIRIHGNDNGIRVHDTSNGSGSFGGVKVHGTGNSNGSPDGIIVHGNSNSNDSLGGIRVHGTDSVGGIRVHGTDAGSVGAGNVHGTSNGNGFLGVNFGMNWNFNNNNMSNHGSSTPMFPSALSSFLGNKDQAQNNLIAQTGAVIPALEKPKMFSDHHDINEVFSDTNNSQFHQNQHQGNLTGVNFEAPTAYPLEDISSWSFNDGTNNEEMLDTLVANLEMYLPTQDMNITNQGNNHEEMFNSLAANPEMHFPTQDMNITNQASLVSIAERFFLTLDYFHDCDDEDFMDYLIDPDMN
ncbi:hypothetical protein F2Q69_00025263 [Brassica cretica]|uniref:Myb-like domain-containing protein n=1 Tax=Brassica cretica TaxID=69181 RepID=A0A8S9QJH5_BRACR|nr:hypothetical protein F2Q69_00025263 [Brassica cretica]